MALQKNTSSVTSIKLKHQEGKFSFKKFRAQAWMQLFVLIGMVYIILFNYVPMVGIIIAFKEFKLASGIAGFFTSRWVGLYHFNAFFNDINFGIIMRNTIVISLLKLIFTFPIPILFAVALNEIRNVRYKKIVQTVSYLPHFISWVVVSGLLFSFLNEQNGLINQLLILFGITDKSVSFLSEPIYFWPIVVISDIWKGMGWWAIIFIAAITGVDPGLYESAIVDGASRLKRIWYITLPSIKGTIIIILILAIGNLFQGGLGGSNFQQSYLLGNPVNYNSSEIIDTYLLRVGLAQGRFSFAAAIGLLQSIISVILIYFSNFAAKKVSGASLF